MEKGRKDSFLLLALIVIVSSLVYIVIDLASSLAPLSRAIMTLVIALSLYAGARRNASTLFIMILSFWSVAIALGVSFSSEYTGTSPLALHIVLTPWCIFALSFVAMWLAVLLYKSLPQKHAFALTLLIVYIFVWCLLSLNVKYFEDWKLENYLTVPFVILIFILYRWFKLSNLSYALIFTFMTLHIVGTHYTYAEVPFGYWLQTFLHLGRNHYDRVVHFSFGFLLAYPMREMFKRIANARGFWSFYVPVDIVFALSAIYEIIEWLTVLVYGGDLGIAYLGSQGDIWDAQKDMLAAGVGSIITMLVTAFVIMYYDAKGFWKEFKSSFTVKSSEPLGEVALQKLTSNRR